MGIVRAVGLAVLNQGLGLVFGEQVGIHQGAAENRSRALARYRRGATEGEAVKASGTMGAGIEISHLHQGAGDGIHHELGTTITHHAHGAARNGIEGIIGWGGRGDRLAHTTALQEIEAVVEILTKAHVGLVPTLTVGHRSGLGPDGIAHKTGIGESLVKGLDQFLIGIHIDAAGVPTGPTDLLHAIDGAPFRLGEAGEGNLRITPEFSTHALAVFLVVRIG